MPFGGKASNNTESQYILIRGGLGGTTTAVYKIPPLLTLT